MALTLGHFDTNYNSNISSYVIDARARLHQTAIYEQKALMCDCIYNIEIRIYCRANQEWQ